MPDRFQHKPAAGALHELLQFGNASQQKSAMLFNSNRSVFIITFLACVLSKGKVCLVHNERLSPCGQTFSKKCKHQHAVSEGSRPGYHEPTGLQGPATRCRLC